MRALTGVVVMLAVLVCSMAAARCPIDCRVVRCAGIPQSNCTALGGTFLPADHCSSCCDTCAVTRHPGESCELSNFAVRVTCQPPSTCVDNVCM